MRNYELAPNRANGELELYPAGEDTVLPQESSNIFKRLFRSAFYGKAVLYPQDVDINKDPVNRQGFSNDSDSVIEDFFSTGYEFVDTPEEADQTVVLPRSVYNTILGDSGFIGLVASKLFLDGSVALIREVAAQRALRDAWWLTYNNIRYYRYNPFDHDPTEQIVIQPNEGGEVSVYNFRRQKFRESQIESIAKAVVLMSQSTRGHTNDLVPNIVVHSAFTDTHFIRSGFSAQPAGQAWSGKPFIELNSRELHGQSGSVGQSWLEQLCVHEIKHQIDDFVNPKVGVFEEYFRYIDDDRDKIIDRVVPTSTNEWKGHSTLAIQASIPHRDYGFTNAKEDLAVTSEEAAFGGEVDPLRRDAYLYVLQRFVDMKEQESGKMTENKSIPIVCDVVNGRKPVPIEVRTGSEIILPKLETTTRPLRLFVQPMKPIRTKIKSLLT